MKYVKFVNSVLMKTINETNKLVLFGQNMNAASCLSGLTRGLGDVNNGLTINTPNCENTQVGVGFGLMLNGISSIFFMKQMDFLLLGIDQLVNTYNIIRQYKPKASFTIFPITLDSGYEGPQSALNNFSDFCSIAGVTGYSFTNKIDTQQIISNYLVKPGFRIMSPSQKLLREDLIDVGVIHQEKECRYFQYKEGNDVTIICFNYSLQYGLVLNDMLSKNNILPSLFSINTFTDTDYTFIIDNIHKTKNLIIIDDTKSKNSVSDIFLKEIYQECVLEQKIVIKRGNKQDLFYPRHDQLDIDYTSIVAKFIK
jgi:pyruvate/2-oxoglutarate/acetoin dehydrogenase E1 component